MSTLDGAGSAAAKCGVIGSDRFIFEWPTDTRDLLRKHVPKLEPGITEFCAHPVADGAELRAYDQVVPFIATIVPARRCSQFNGMTSRRASESV